ncbi:hypothetical protein LPJ61_005615 [Coemansia biformis]|uniref:Peptidase S1 domain-containing protein n=1 Tax=Coemansia biformis TaxID=1286918 RepID=A0A9W7Y2T1_9FUNG|nr:hypothetical protein LPJ61_005615 [Coemansia biformis]
MLFPDSTVAGTFPSAILMVDMKQSFCPVIIVSGTAGVAAASCFDYDEKGKADVSRYSLATGGSAQPTGSRLQLTSVTKHSGYNPTTFSNNIAVVQFAVAALPDPMRVGVGTAPTKWSRKILVHRALTDDGFSWLDYETTSGAAADASACGAASTLFQNYQSDYLCSITTRTSMYNQQCVMPYKYVLAVNGESLSQLGFYSHSAIQDATNYCAKSTIYNYYLFIANYIPWINSIINPAITAVSPPDDQRHKIPHGDVDSGGVSSHYDNYRNYDNHQQPTVNHEHHSYG